MTADNHQRQDDMVCLPRTEFESLLEQAACRGARKALKEVGLADEEPVHDIHDLRDLVSSIKAMQRTFLQTVLCAGSPLACWRCSLQALPPNSDPSPPNKQEKNYANITWKPAGLFIIRVSGFFETLA